MKKKKTLLKRRRLAVANVFAMDFTFPDSFAPQWNTTVETLNKECELVAVQFHTPLPKGVAQRVQVSVTHVATHSCACRLPVLPSDTPCVERRTLTDALRYLAFETHALQLDAESGDVTRMFLALENTQLKDPHATPRYEPVMNYAWFFRQRFGDRYVALPYFPPDVDIDLRSVNVLASQVPQSTPMWFKVRTEVTGSRIPRLVGEFAPRLHTRAAATFQLHGNNSNGDDFTSGWRGISMRLGNQRECVQVGCILSAFPQLTFEETGFIRHATHVDYGASPDGFLVDPQQTWAGVPEVTRAAYPHIKERITRGVVEFKASRKECAIHGYHLMQCCWEMACADVAWCDIVRYKEAMEPDRVTRVHSLVYECKKVRIYRCPETEAEMMRLVEQSRACQSAEAYLRLVWSEPFVAFRARFTALADQCNANATPVPVPVDLVDAMRERRAQCSKQDAHESTPSLHPALDRIEERQAQVLSAYGHGNSPQAFIELATDQIHDYAQLVQDAFSWNAV